MLRPVKKETLIKGETKLLEVIVKAAEEKQASNITVLDISRSANVVDFLVIAGAESIPQLKAVAKEIDHQLEKFARKGYRWEGVIGSKWLVLDLGNIVIHLMGLEERRYYDLESLWGKEAVVYHY